MRASEPKFPREIPIIFSAPMVRALLEGRKTQTRRLLPLQPPPEVTINYPLGAESWLPANQRTNRRHYFEAWHGPLYDQRPEGHLCGHFESPQRYRIGDRLYVREAWRTHRSFDNLKPKDVPAGSAIQFEVGGLTDRTGHIRDVGKYRYARFMPRWMSRLTLTVTDVRVQRLQEITYEEIFEEGCPDQWQSANAWYREVWNGLHGKDAWDANPWVCAISFECRKGNIDDGSC